MKIDAKEVGDRIIALRKKHHIAHYKDLAAKLPGDKSPETVRRWEKGDTLPPWLAVKEMADLFSVEEDEILFGERQQKPVLTYVMPDEQALLDAYRRTKKEMHNLALASLKTLADQYPSPEATVTQLRQAK